MASHPVDEPSLTASTDRSNRPRATLRRRGKARPLARRLAALLAHRDRLLAAAQAVVKERERELEMARLELRAAEYAHDVLERKLEELSSEWSTHGCVRASVDTWTARDTSPRNPPSSP